MIKNRMNALRVPPQLTDWVKNAFARRPRHRRRALTRSFQVETLETRTMLSVTIGSLLVNDMPTSKDEFVAVPITNSTTNPVTYTVSSTNSNVTASVLTGGRSLKLNVTGRDSTNTPFTGDMTFRLFESEEPITTARIIALAQSNFYTGIIFHRVLQDFVAQGGDPTGTGGGGSNVKFNDEFNLDLTFTSQGLLAMANSGDDTNDSQFFITDVDLPLANLPQHLNFQHNIFGILTSGQDIFRKLISTPVNGSGKPNTNETINSATVFDDNQNGVIRLKSTAGFTGNSTITVTANDQNGSTDQKQFTLNVVADTQSNVALNDRAFLGTVSNQTTNQGTPITFNVQGFDLESDALTFVVKDAASFVNDTDTGTAPANVGVSINVTPASGSTPAVAAITLTPQGTFTGTVSLRVGVRDGTNRGTTLDAKSNFDTQAITLTVNAVPTVANPIPDQTFTGSGTKSFTFATNTFADADAGDILTYTAALVGGSALPAWLVFDGATRTFSGNPGGTDITPLQLRVTASDGRGGSVFDDFQLTLTNVSDPTTLANPIPDQTFFGSGAKAFTFATNTFSGDGLTYTATLVGGGALPSWLTFDSATRTFSGNPGLSSTMSFAIHVTATDVQNATASDDFQLNLDNSVNDNPVLATIGDKKPVEGATTVFTISATDADVPADTLTFSASGLPSGATFDPASRTFTWKPTTAQANSNFTATFSVSDGTVGTASQTINLFVVPQQTVFRAYLASNSDHFFTTSNTQFQAALAGGYTDESSTAGAYRVGQSQMENGSVIFRLANPATNINGGGHYYTASVFEKDFLVGIGWILENSEGFLFQNQVAGSVEVFRLYNTTSGKHVFTTSTAERDSLVTAGWILHSRLGFAFLPTSTNSQPAVAFPMMAAATASADDAADSPSIPGIADAAPVIVASAETSTTPSLFSTSGLGDLTITGDSDLDAFWGLVAQNLESDPGAELLD